MKKNMHDNLGDDEKEQVRKNDIKRKRGKHVQALDERSIIFNNVETFNMADPCILTTLAFRLIEEDFKRAMQEDPTYICDTCWKSKF